VPQRLGQRAISLGAANAIDYAMQFLLPVVLVRYLTPEAFAATACCGWWREPSWRW